MAALRDPLQKDLAGSQDDDRPAVSSASEAIAGLLASGVPFSGVRPLPPPGHHPLPIRKLSAVRRLYTPATAAHGKSPAPQGAIFRGRSNS